MVQLVNPPITKNGQGLPGMCLFYLLCQSMLTGLARISGIILLETRLQQASCLASVFFQTIVETKFPWNKTSYWDVHGTWVVRKLGNLQPNRRVCKPLTI